MGTAHRPNSTAPDDSSERSSSPNVVGPSTPSGCLLQAGDRPSVLRWEAFLSSLSPAPSCFRPVIGTLQAALSGQPINVDCDEWARPLAEHQENMVLAGHVSTHWQQWRSLMPDRTDIWRDVLKQGWRDPKKDLDFDYSEGSEAFPSGHISPTDKLMGAELDKLERLGVHEPFRLEDVDPSRPFHVSRHGLVEKTDEDAMPNGEWRLVLKAWRISENEDPGTFQGPTDSQFAEWLDPGAYMLRLDAKKFFHQIRCREKNRQLFSFYHPVTRRLRRYTCMVMGAAGGSKCAQKIMAAVAAHLQAVLGIKIFVYCDEGISSHVSRLMAFLQHLVYVLTLIYLGVILNFPKSDRRSPTQQCVFIGVMASTAPLRVSPSPGRLRIIRARAGRLLEAIKTGRRLPGTLLRQLLGSARSCLRLHQTIPLWTIKINAVVRQHAMRHGQSKRQFAALLDRSALQWTVAEIRFLAESHPDLEWRFAMAQTDADHVFVTDASEWGMGGQGLSPSLMGLNMHQFYPPEVQREHHNYQEGVAPVEYLNLVHEEQWVPHGTATTPQFFEALVDNITIMSLFLKLRTKSMPLAKYFRQWIPVWHQRGWMITARHVIKLTMDSVFSVDDWGRMFSAWWERAIPVLLLLLLLAFFGFPPLTVLLDLFATYTVRRSNLWVSAAPDTREPKALWHDAFHPLMRWNPVLNSLIRPEWLLYAFPADRQLAAVLERVTRDACSSILLVSRFSSSFPLRKVCQLAISPMCFFALHPSNLVPPEGFAHAPMLEGPTVTFVAVILSGQIEKRKAFLKPLTEQCCEGGMSREGQMPYAATTLDGHHGLISSKAAGCIRSASPQLLSAYFSSRLESGTRKASS